MCENLLIMDKNKLLLKLQIEHYFQTISSKYSIKFDAVPETCCIRVAESAAFLDQDLSELLKFYEQNDAANQEASSLSPPAPPPPPIPLQQIQERKTDAQPPLQPGSTNWIRHHMQHVFAPDVFDVHFSKKKQQQNGLIQQSENGVQDGQTESVKQQPTSGSSQPIAGFQPMPPLLRKPPAKLLKVGEVTDNKQRTNNPERIDKPKDGTLNSPSPLSNSFAPLINIPSRNIPKNNRPSLVKPTRVPPRVKMPWQKTIKTQQQFVPQKLPAENYRRIPDFVPYRQPPQFARNGYLLLKQHESPETNVYSQPFHVPSQPGLFQNTASFSPFTKIVKESFAKESFKNFQPYPKAMRNELRRQLFDVRALEDSRTNEGGIPSFTNNNFKENVENMKDFEAHMKEYKNLFVPKPRLQIQPLLEDDLSLNPENNNEKIRNPLPPQNDKRSMFSLNPLNEHFSIVSKEKSKNSNINLQIGLYSPRKPFSQQQSEIISRISENDNALLNQKLSHLLSADKNFSLNGQPKPIFERTGNYDSSGHASLVKLSESEPRLQINKDADTFAQTKVYLSPRAIDTQLANVHQYGERIKKASGTTPPSTFTNSQQIAPRKLKELPLKSLTWNSSSKADYAPKISTSSEKNSRTINDDDILILKSFYEKLKKIEASLLLAKSKQPELFSEGLKQFNASVELVEQETEQPESVPSVAKTEKLWTGLHRSTKLWNWSDGTAVNYLNWAVGQPDGCCGPNVNCVTVNAGNLTGSWSDAECSSKAGYICQYDLNGSRPKVVLNGRIKHVGPETVKRVSDTQNPQAYHPNLPSVTMPMHIQYMQSLLTNPAFLSAYRNNPRVNMPYQNPFMYLPSQYPERYPFQRLYPSYFSPR